MPSEAKRLGILISGRGSNLQAIVRNIDAGRLGACIEVVISNQPDAAGLEFAKAAHLPCVSLPSQGVRRSEYDRQLAAELRARNVDLICLAGFMRLLSPEFVQQFPMRVLNIHPSLLPAFPGLNAQSQALRHGVKITGCTVHFVNEELDSGPIILQIAVPVHPDDTEDTLSARILEQEHRVYSEAISLVLSNNYRIEGRRFLLTP